jgi:hypothetical protein
MALKPKCHTLSPIWTGDHIPLALECPLSWRPKEKRRLTTSTPPHTEKLTRDWHIEKLSEEEKTTLTTSIQRHIQAQIPNWTSKLTQSNQESTLPIITMIIDKFNNIFKEAFSRKPRPLEVVPVSPRIST